MFFIVSRSTNFFGPSTACSLCSHAVNITVPISAINSVCFIRIFFLVLLFNNVYTNNIIQVFLRQAQVQHLLQLLLPDILVVLVIIKKFDHADLAVIIAFQDVFLKCVVVAVELIIAVGTQLHGIQQLLIGI